ncbi:hypothetical protein BJ508DRAFT_64531 [Ascobolus immersus RN42]|uniref:Uncharacterized protein n=1 Tax=Ascobolus immersus RN42 TaxID=1160509 RepID=A0A3N4IQ01_ASCIM|nr:hypothetical protein BJ508DRAFT_64531 [Ascobolus immersus RN42]
MHWDGFSCRFLSLLRFFLTGCSSTCFPSFPDLLFIFLRVLYHFFVVADCAFCLLECAFRFCCVFVAGYYSFVFFIFYLLYGVG